MFKGVPFISDCCRAEKKREIEREEPWRCFKAVADRWKIMFPERSTLYLDIGYASMRKSAEINANT